MRLAILVLCVAIGLTGLLPGCHPAPQRSPFALVDDYLGYLTPEERTLWCDRIAESGLESAVHDLLEPSTFWYTTVNVYGSKTPKGTLTPEQYATYTQEGWMAMKRLRDYTNSFPPSR
jgi:hypothetical protein